MQFQRLAFIALLAMAATLTSSLSGQAQSTHTVIQKDGQYLPESLTIKAGDTVVFRNDDTIPHHVVSHTPTFKFDADLIQPGGQSSVAFPTKGTIVVGCDIHLFMEMKIIVE